MLRIIFPFVFLVLASVSLAQSNAEFYSSTVAVADREANTLRLALRDALVQVLSKASGASVEEVQARSSLAQDLAQGDKLASQFVYYQQKMLNSTGAETQQLRIKASFAETQIMNLLQKGGLTFWSPVRKPLEFWLLSQQSGRIAWLHDNELSQKQLQYWQAPAQLRWGFDINSRVVPEYNAQRLWFADQTYMDVLAKQEADKQVVIGKIDTLEEGQVSGTLSLLQQDEQTLLTASDLTQWMDQAMQWLSSVLVKQEAVQLSVVSNEVALQVTGVNSDADYQQLLALLEKINVIQQVYVLSINRDAIKLSVRFTTEAAQLKKRLLDTAHFQSSADNSDSLYQFNLVWVNP
jgi:hypothetical protein